MNPIDNEGREEMKILKHHVEQLGEHFDTVQIFVMRRDEDDPNLMIRCTDGCGNWFARYGQVALWLKAETAMDTAAASQAEEEEE